MGRKPKGCCEYYYVYRITCTASEASQGPKHYYGYRSSLIPPDQDTNYWSSSKYVSNAIKNYGIQQFKKKIIACYSTRERAMSLEIKLHDKFDVKNNDMFFNRANQTSIGFVTGGPLSVEHKQKIRQHALGRRHTDECRQKMSHTRRAMAASGNYHTEETKRKISETAKANAAKLLSKN